MKRFYIPTLFFLLTLVSCDQNTKTEETKQEIIVNIEAEPTLLDPRKARLITDYNVIKTFCEGLYRTNKEGKTAPALVEKATISKDRKRYEFELKKTFWSNGDSLTAHDFVFAWKSALHKDFPAANANLLYPIKNAKQIKSGELPASMIGAYAKDDYTLVVELEKPIPYFIELLKNVIYFPINQSHIIKHPECFTHAAQSISNGPFILTSWKNKNEITLEKNPYYWESDVVQLQHLTLVMVDPDTGFNMFQQKDLHWVGAPNSRLPLDSIESLKRTDKLGKTPLLATYWIRVNTNKEYLKSKELRNSLAQSIDRHSICKHILHGEGNPATGLVPKLLGLQKNPYFKDGNIEEAQRLFKESSMKKPLSLTLSFADVDNHKTIAQAIQDQWKKSLGIDIKLEPLEAKIYFDKISNGDYELACGRWVADYEDPVSFLDVYKTKQVGTNCTGWENSEYIKALDDSFNHTGEERRALLHKSESILMKDMPVIPVYNLVMLHLQDEKLHDVVLTEISHIDFKYAYVKKEN